MRKMIIGMHGGKQWHMALLAVELTCRERREIEWLCAGDSDARRAFEMVKDAAKFHRVWCAAEFPIIAFESGSVFRFVWESPSEFAATASDPRVKA